MSDFNYEIETTNHYFFENFTVDGQSVQDGTPTPSVPVPVEVVEPVNGVFGISVNGVVTPIDLQGNVLASLPDGTKDVLTVDSAGHVLLEKHTNRVKTSELNWGISTPSSHIYRAKFETTRTPLPYNYGSASNYALSTAFEQIAWGPISSSTIGRFAIGQVGTNDHRLVAIDDRFTTQAEFEAANANVEYVYRLATPQTIDLGYIDVSNLKDISEEIPISIISTLDPETTYSYINHPSYDVLNPYEDYNAPEYAYPPNHFGQEWETFDANNWNKTDMLDYTGRPESHAVYTVELCELMQSGAFDWKRPEIDWSEAAYDAEQYDRFCKYFESRFMFREISMLPPLQWFTALKRMMVYELMPKYRPLYAQVENGISPLGENEYYKERHVSSAYPETLLSGNSDYISSGEDKEFERIKVDNAAEALEAYRNGFRSVDAAIGDELEVLFISMYTSFANAL